MRNDFQLSLSMITFESLDDVLGSIDDAIDVHHRAIERYSDILGTMLRKSVGENQVQIRQMNAPPSSGKSQKDRRSEDEQGWLILEADDYALRVSNGPTTLVDSHKVVALFKIVEALKSKVTSLESARKLMADLPSKGFNANQRISVVFKDGLPRQILPTGETSAEQPKFGYAGEFQIEPMRLK
jgi:hypothetical protein